MRIVSCHKPFIPSGVEFAAWEEPQGDKVCNSRRKCVLRITPVHFASKPFGKGSPSPFDQSAAHQLMTTKLFFTCNANLSESGFSNSSRSCLENCVHYPFGSGRQRRALVGQPNDGAFPRHSLSNKASGNG